MNDREQNLSLLPAAADKSGESGQQQVYRTLNTEHCFDPQTQYLNHAIRQITDWRAWLKSNQAYASRPRSENGLGLTNIDSNIKGLILIGRRATIDSETNARRRQLVQDMNIEIHSYDYLLESLKGRLISLKKLPE